ncbi:MAG: NUDIX hydrolase, partial [Polyangiales bacterium]
SSLPAIRLEVTEDYPARSKCDEGYLRLKRRFIKAHYPEGGASEPFKYDAVERWNQDAVSVLLHFVRDGVRHVILRSAVRPPLALRPQPLVEAGIPYPPGARQGELWEVPAGLIEKDETGREGLINCVVRETKEEVGIDLDRARVKELGGVLFPSSGIIGEAVFLFEAEIDPPTALEPEGDGPLEKGAKLALIPFDRALDWCDRGLLPDGKTELSLRRLDSRLRRG